MAIADNMDGNCQQLEWQLSCMNRTRVFASSKMCSTIRTDSFCRTKYLTSLASIDSFFCWQNLLALESCGFEDIYMCF